MRLTPYGENTLMHTDEVMERAESDEILSVVTTSPAGEDNVMPLKRTP